MKQKKIVPYRKQNYEDLKKELKQSGVASLFCDPVFPAVSASLGNTPVPHDVHWKRPTELSRTPRLFSDIELSHLVVAGELSSNWMVSACAILASIKELLNKIIPDYWEQEWDSTKPDQYCGIFHFRFWRFGEWVDVVIDDLLPTYDNMLLSMHGKTDSEFWASLLEKSYAKLHGSYEALQESSLSDALVDFTAGVSQVIDLKGEEYINNDEKRWGLFETLALENIDHSIMCFNVTLYEEDEAMSRTDLGLKRGYAYHVTDVKRAYLGETGLRNLFKGREKVAMVRLRDSSDMRRKSLSRNSSEKNGDNAGFAYSTSHLSRLLSKNASWSQVKDDEFERLGLAVQDKNEFWMPFEDVISQFTELTICRLFTNNLFAAPIRKWHEVSIRGEWTTGVRWTSADRAGGGSDFPDTLLRNPQYLFDLEEESDLVVQLMQWNESPASRTSLKYLIGFIIIKVEDNRTTRLHKQWNHCPTVISQGHQRRREINYSGHLPIGRYIIIPSTYKPGDQGHYLLRLFTLHNIKLRELKTDIPSKVKLCPCLNSDPEWVTIMLINKAENLSQDFNFWGKKKLNPYCVVICENTEGRTPVAKDDKNPEWNSSFVFFRRKVDTPLKLQVYSQNLLMPNQLLGEAEVPALVTRSFTPLQLRLTMKQKDSNESLNSFGTLYLQVMTEDNLMAV